MEHPANTFRVGLGYRKGMHDATVALDARLLDFVELAPENYCGLGGRWRRRLAMVREKWPIITHGLAMSFGGEAPLDASLIEGVAELVADVGSPHHSDHLCWSSIEGSHLHELLPMPFTRDAAKRTAERIKSVQAEFPVPLAIENVSAYLRRPEDEMDEPEFVSEVVSRSGCKLLLDVNNIFVNAANFGGDAMNMLSRFPCSEAIQIHIAGHHHEGELIIDTHAAPVVGGVWSLLEAALARTGPVPVLLERDHEFPPMSELLAELEVIRRIGARVFGPRAEAAHG